jgi:antitoxin (DNA-binding transcriptional repressor) of toxin-antitoxin stability system
MAEVVGSSPTSSTSQIHEPITIGSEDFRDRMGEWMHRVAAGEEILVTYRGRAHVRVSPAEPIAAACARTPPPPTPGPAPTSQHGPRIAAEVDTGFHARVT